MEATREETSRTNHDSNENEARFAGHLQSKRISPWPVVVIGHPEIGFKLHRHDREPPYKLEARDLDRAVEEAITLGVGLGHGFDEIFRRHHPRPKPPGYGFVYFVGGEDGPVKIGFARRPLIRLAGLQTGSPVLLSILAQVAASFADEDAYHKRFAAYRLHGEWFERCPEILAEIERLNAPNPGIPSGGI